MFNQILIFKHIWKGFANIPFKYVLINILRCYLLDIYYLGNKNIKVIKKINLKNNQIILFRIRLRLFEALGTAFYKSHQLVLLEISNLGSSPSRFTKSKF